MPKIHQADVKVARISRCVAVASLCGLASQRGNCTFQSASTDPAMEYEWPTCNSLLSLSKGASRCPAACV
eukprot:4523173-Amphidinium_carterae.1